MRRVRSGKFEASNWRSTIYMTVRSKEIYIEREKRDATLGEFLIFFAEG